MMVICPVCPHHCHLEEGQTGRCRVRRNVGGKTVDGNWGKVTALALDPIEKKPLRCFYPGSRILSVGSYGCNLDCPFCQNAGIAAVGEGAVETVELTPEALADMAEQARPQGNIGVAFTYNEPLVGWEYVAATSRLVHDRGMKTVAVTNGCVTGAAAREVLPHLDALNIDLKVFTTEGYRRLGGDLDTVQTFIRLAVEAGCHVELTTLVVPGFNDDEGLMAEEAAWIAGIDPEIPLHVTRFFPAHRMARAEPTPVSTVYHLADTAAQSLNTVYVGNC